MKKRYAIEIKKPDLYLVSMLSGGKDFPDPKERKTWFVFDIDETGAFSNERFVTQRELLRDYDLYVHGPSVVRLKI